MTPIIAASSLLSAPSRRRVGAPAGPWAGGPIHSLLSRLLRWLDAWEDRRHLHSLSDHTLRDMGFTRDQIDDVLRGAVRRP